MIDSTGHSKGGMDLGLAEVDGERYLTANAELRTTNENEHGWPPNAEPRTSNSELQTPNPAQQTSHKLHEDRSGT